MTELFLKQQSFRWILKCHGESCCFPYDYVAFEKLLKICFVIHKQHVDMAVLVDLRSQYMEHCNKSQAERGKPLFL